MPGIAAGGHIRAPMLSITLDRFLGQDVTTTIATGGTEAALSWGLAQTTSPNVTVTGNPLSSRFSLNKTGVWCIEFCVRVAFGTGPTTGDIYAYLYHVTSGQQVIGETEPSPITSAFSPLLQSRTLEYFQAGDQVEVRLRNSTNQVLGLAQVPDLSHISLTWMQPQ